MITNGIFCRMQAGYPILLGARLPQTLDRCVRRTVSYTFIIMSSLTLYIIRWRKSCFSLIEGTFVYIIFEEFCNYE